MVASARTSSATLVSVSLEATCETMPRRPPIAVSSCCNAAGSSRATMASTFCDSVRHRLLEADQAFSRRERAERFAHINQAVFDAGQRRSIDAGLARVIDALRQRLDLDLERLQRAARQRFVERVADGGEIVLQAGDRRVQISGGLQRFDPRGDLAELLLQQAQVERFARIVRRVVGLRTGWERLRLALAERALGRRIVVERALPRFDFARRACRRAHAGAPRSRRRRGQSMRRCGSSTRWLTGGSSWRGRSRRGRSGRCGSPR